MPNYVSWHPVADASATTKENPFITFLAGDDGAGDAAAAEGSDCGRRKQRKCPLQASQNLVRNSGFR